MTYILDGHTPVPCDDILKWAECFGKADRHVAKDSVGDVKISTVFLGLDHGFSGGPPLFFETMIFGGKHDGYQDRYSTWDEAVAGHRRAVEMVKDRGELEE